MNYVEMVERLGKSINLLYVVHGWTEDEIRYSVELFLGEKRVATPSYLGETKVRAVRTGPTGLTSAEKKIALGSYMMLKNPHCRAGELDLAELAKYYIKTVPKKAVWTRLAQAMNILRQHDFEIFVLGGGSPNTCHLIFLCGARVVDGSSWHFAAMLGRVFIPEWGEARPEEIKQSDRLYRLMKEYWDRPENLLRDVVDLDDFLYYTSEPWRRLDEAARRKYARLSYTAFLMRATWNLYALHVEEQIANEKQRSTCS